MARIANAHVTLRRSSRVLRTIVLKTAQKWPFLDTKSAVEQASRLKMQRNLFVVMRLCSPIVSSYLDTGFEPRCGHKDFWNLCLLAACCCCCSLLKRVAQPWPLKGGVKPRQGKPSWVIKTPTRTELGPSLAQRIGNHR